MAPVSIRARLALVTLVTLVSSGGCGGLAAAEPLGWYAGLSRATSHVEVWRGLGWEQASQHGSVAVRGGLRLRKRLALELGLQQANGLDWHEYYAQLPGLPSSYDATTTFDSTSLDVSAVGILPFGKIFEGILKGGLVQYHTAGSQSLVEVRTNTPVAPRAVSDSGSDVVIGLGLGARLPRGWLLRVEWQTFGIGNGFLGAPAADWPTLDSFAIGVDYRFDRRPR